MNATSTTTGPLDAVGRRGVGCQMHHNALGFSGTAGNSVYVHDNRIAPQRDRLRRRVDPRRPPRACPGPRLVHPQQDLRQQRELLRNVQGDDAPCHADKPRDVGHQRGVVCPAFGLPVGTGGMLIGNHNFVSGNQIYDNWRSGMMLFWVPPAALRGEYDPTKQFDNSNHNALHQERDGLQPPGGCSPTVSTSGGTTPGSATAGRTTSPPPGAAITHNATHARPSRVRIPVDARRRATS